MSVLGWTDDLAIKKIIYQNPKIHTSLFDLVNPSELESLTQLELESLKLQILSEPIGDGEEKIISRDIYMPIIRKSVLMSKKGIVWPDQIFIRNFSHLLNVESLKDRIVSQLKVICQTCDFQIVDVKGYETMPEYYQEWGIENINTTILSQAMQMDLVVDKKIFPLSVSLMARDRVPVTKYNLKIGQELTAKSIDFQLRDISDIKLPYPKSADEFKNTILKKSILKNQVLSTNDYAKVQVVKAGQSLKLIAAHPEWHMDTEVFAHAGGSIGDLIPVKIKKTNKVVDAKIISDREVEISL